MLISIFWHFHPPYVFSTFFFPIKSETWRCPAEVSLRKRNFQWNGYWMKTWKPAASPRTNKIHQLSHRADKRGQHRGRHINFYTPRTSADKICPFQSHQMWIARTSADKRQLLQKSRGHPRTSADIPRTTANAMFSLTTDHAAPSNAWGPTNLQPSETKPSARRRSTSDSKRSAKIYFQFFPKIMTNTKTSKKNWEISIFL